MTSALIETQINIHNSTICVDIYMVAIQNIYLSYIS